MWGSVLLEAFVQAPRADVHDVVRTLLVPALMELLGDRNWWMPRWLDRILPKISVEAEDDTDRDVLDDELIENLGAYAFVPGHGDADQRSRPT